MKLSSSPLVWNSEHRIPRLLNAFRRLARPEDSAANSAVLSSVRGHLSFLKQLFLPLRQSVIVLDLNGTVVTANPFTLEQLGLKRDEVEGVRFHETGCILPEELTRLKRMYLRFLQGGPPQICLHLRHRSRELWSVEASASLIQLDNRLWHVVIFLRDLEPEVKRINELKRLFTRFRRARRRGEDPLRLVSLCCHCRRARTETNDWEMLEKYLSSRSSIRFSHGICPDCITSHFPDQAERITRRWETREKCRQSTTASPDSDRKS